MTNSNLYIIIQARMTSTRLPGKVLLPLLDKTVLEVIIDRLYEFKENIIIATTDDGTEKPIVNLCKKINLKYFKGSVNNVLDRYYRSAKYYGVNKKDIIVRITSDCPLIDLNIMRNVIELYYEGDYDYVSNRINRTIPIGLDVEVFNFEILEDTFNNASSDFEKEHVTPYIYNRKDKKFKIGAYQDKVDNSKYRLTLDEEDDYIAIKEIYTKFQNTSFSYEELIEILEKNSYIYEINKNVIQK